MLSIRHIDDTKIEAGIDEAGRGAFWGPLMAGAVIWPDERAWTDDHRLVAVQIRDSKKIAPKKRKIIAEHIKRLATSWGVGTVSAQELDDKGVTWANQEAFRRAIDCLAPLPDRLLIDGVVRLSSWTAEQQTIVDGDATYLPIAAASILAKVEHDDWVHTFCKENEVIAERYSLGTSKGYGTAKHRDALRAYGAHELHRRTYIYNYIGGNSPQQQQRPVSTKKDKCLIQLH